MNPVRLAALMSVLVSAAALADPPDPIEGKWHGTAGFPQDRIEIGLEIVRNEKGEMKAYLYEPVVNFYGLESRGWWSATATPTRSRSTLSASA